MPTNTKPCQEPANAAMRDGLPPAYYHLYGLLHTLHALAAQQDHICTLLADMKRTGKVTASVRRELTAVLHDLPSVSLQTEIESVFAALEP